MRAPWAGRAIALLAIVVLALSLRSAVSAISPIVAQISADIELSSVGLGLLGALPPVFFALVGVIAPPIAKRVGSLWRSRTAWAIAITFAVTSINAYAMFAWLPKILVQTVGVTNVQAGALLALYSFIAVPGSIAAPILVSRLRHPGWVIQGGVLAFLAGYAGLLLAPGAAVWLWVALIGIGPVLFPVCLTLVNLRTRSQQASAALSGFVQAIGYSLAALGPLTVGVLHDLTGGWRVPMLALVGVALVGVVCGVILSKPRFVEQDLEART